MGGLSGNAWFAIAVAIAIFAAMFFSKLRADVVFLAGMSALFVSGVCTLIGTPTNLIVSGLYTDKTGNQLNIFTTTTCGLFCLAVGIISVIAMQKLLPERKSILGDGEDDELTMELRVPAKHPFIGFFSQRSA